MTREEAQERLLDYVYGELPDNESQQVQRWLHADADLQAEWRALGGVKAAYERLAPVQLPPALHSAMMLNAQRALAENSLVAQAASSAAPSRPRMDADLESEAPVASSAPSGPRWWERILTMMMQPAFAGAFMVVVVASVGMYTIRSGVIRQEAPKYNETLPTGVEVAASSAGGERVQRGDGAAPQQQPPSPPAQLEHLAQQRDPGANNEPEIAEHSGLAEAAGLPIGEPDRAVDSPREDAAATPPAGPKDMRAADKGFAGKVVGGSLGSGVANGLGSGGGGSTTGSTLGSGSAKPSKPKAAPAEVERKQADSSVTLLKKGKAATQAQEGQYGGTGLGGLVSGPGSGGEGRASGTAAMPSLDPSSSRGLSNVGPTADAAIVAPQTAAPPPYPAAKVSSGTKVDVPPAGSAGRLAEAQSAMARRDLNAMEESDAAEAFDDVAAAQTAPAAEQVRDEAKKEGKPATSEPPRAPSPESEADALASSGAHGEAAKLYKKALASSSDPDRVRIKLAKSLMAIGDMQGADRVLAEVKSSSGQREAAESLRNELGSRRVRAKASIPAGASKAMPMNIDFEDSPLGIPPASAPAPAPAQQKAK